MSYDSSGRDTKWSLLVLEMISDIKTPAVKISGKDTKVFSKDTCDLSSHGMVPGLHHVQYFRTTSWLWNDKPFDFFPVAYQDLHRSISSQQLVLSAKEQRSDPSEEFAQPAKSPGRAFTRSDSNESKRGRVGPNVRKNSWRRNSTNILWATSYPTQHQFSYPLSQATPSIWVAQSLGRPFPTWDLQMRNIQSTGPGSANEVLELPGQRQSYPVREVHDKPLCDSATIWHLLHLWRVDQGLRPKGRGRKLVGQGEMCIEIICAATFFSSVG
jgi:hypothetical protein